MKKLWQLILVSVILVSCACAFACDEIEPTCEHDYVASVVEATCGQGGYTDHTCSKCGDTYRDGEVAALGHDLTEWAEKIAATCSSGQTMERHCKRQGCDYEETKAGEIEKLDHDLTEWAEKTAATCEADQVMERHCQRQGCTYEETKTGEIAKLGHDLVWTVDTPATCTESGVKHGDCSRCDYVESDVVINKLGHHLVPAPDDDAAIEATCTEDGLAVEVCDRGCGYRVETPIFALGHTDDGSKAEVVSATCTEDGYTIRHCGACGDNFNDTIVPAPGHDWSEITEVAATCSHIGSKSQTCLRSGCGEVKVLEESEKLKHVFNEAGECLNGCEKTIADKFTWISTQYDVEYDEANELWKLDGGDCKKGNVASKIFIPAEVIKAMADEGAMSVTFTMVKRANTTPRFGYNLTTTGNFDGEGLQQVNNVNLDFTVEITEDMKQNGIEFWTFYYDLTIAEPAWGGTELVTGFDFRVVFNAPFNAENKNTWMTTTFDSVKYDEAAAKWVVEGSDPGKDVTSASLTVKGEVFAAMREAGKNYFVISLDKQFEDQHVIFGHILAHESTYTEYPENHYASNKIAITDAMIENGYTFTVLYADQNQRANKPATHVTGFLLDVLFGYEKPFDINDKNMWLDSGFENTVYSEEKDLWVISGDPGASGIQKSVIIKADVFKALPESVVSFKVKMICQDATQRPYFALKHDGIDWADKHGHTGALAIQVAITEAMRTSGFTFSAKYLDNTQANPAWGGAVVTGFDLGIEFIKAFDVNDKSTWISEAFNTCKYLAEEGKWFVTGNSFDGATLTIKPELIAAMADSGKTAVKIRFRQSAGYGKYVVSGDVVLNQNTEWTPEQITLTDAMRTNGINLTVSVSDNGWNGLVMDGFFITIEFVS